jgi:hypothetical protein
MDPCGSRVAVMSFHNHKIRWLKVRRVHYFVACQLDGFDE